MLSKFAIDYVTLPRHHSRVLTPSQFDRMLKVAAERIASSLLRESLGLDAVAVHDRFGLAA